MMLYKGITTKANYYACNDDKRSKGGCDMETGYYLSPSEACETYSTFGRLPSLDSNGRSIVCVRPGRLTDVFGVSSQLTELTSMWVDKTVK